jgi:glycosyltransferase involved in cell wall biosynthesis
MLNELRKMKGNIQNWKWIMKSALYRRVVNAPLVATVAINMRPLNSSWGGGNQWINQFIPFLAIHGYRVTFNLNTSVDLILLISPQVGGFVTFSSDDVEIYKKLHPKAKCILRINDNDKHRGVPKIDALLQHANRVADFSIFISNWVLDYHASLWFDKKRPHAVIVNGADSKIFNPVRSEKFSPSETLRLVTHHWSDNWNKGFDVYLEIDRLIAEGQLQNTELWIIGRWPKEAKWQRAKTFEPKTGIPLADLLRQCHIYITASKWEAGGMHHIEGAQCGLPVIFHEDGGGIVELAQRYGIGYRDNVLQAVLLARTNYDILRDKVLLYGPSGDQMCLEYLRIIQRLIT